MELKVLTTGTCSGLRTHPPIPSIVSIYTILLSLYICHSIHICYTFTTTSTIDHHLELKYLTALGIKTNKIPIIIYLSLYSITIKPTILIKYYWCISMRPCKPLQGLRPPDGAKVIHQ